MKHEEWNIGGRYNTMSLMNKFKDCMYAIIKLIAWLDKKGRWGMKLGGGGVY